MSEGSNSKALPIVRWIARVSSGLAAGLILLIFVGEGIAGGFEPLFDLTTRERPHENRDKGAAA